MHGWPFHDFCWSPVSLSFQQAKLMRFILHLSDQPLDHLPESFSAGTRRIRGVCPHTMPSQKNLSGTKASLFGLFGLTLIEPFFQYARTTRLFSAGPSPWDFVHWMLVPTPSSDFPNKKIEGRPLVFAQYKSAAPAFPMLVMLPHCQ